jgi:hypothetical protein
VTDDELTDVWEACELGRSITHLEHVRIALVLLRRYGRETGGVRIAEGTQRNCVALGVADRYDESLTQRWVDAIADAVELADRGDFDAFLTAHPELGMSDLLGLPAWRLRPDT